MKKIFSLLILVLGSSIVFAGKEYKFKLKVYSLGTKEIVKNASVSFRSGKSNEIIIAGNTNEFGEILIEHLKDKYATFYINDEIGEHNTYSHYLYNDEKIDQEKTIYLRWTKKKEIFEFNKIDEKYNLEALENKEISTDSSEITNAEPIGGMAEFQKYLTQNLEYPSVSLELGKQGKVYLSFYVEKDGTITNVTILKGVDEYINSEAIRLLRYSPKWKPSSQKGKNIKAKLTLPINFTLN